MRFKIMILRTFKRKQVFLLTVFGALMLILTIFQMNDSVTFNNKKPTNFLKRLFNPGRRGTREPVNVLVLTYMRSGSSLVGDILQQSKGSFYLYEPLRTFGFQDPDSYVIKYANGATRQPPYEFSEEANRIVYDLFTCNIENIPNITLTDKFMNKNFSSSTSTMPECIARMQRIVNETTALRMCARKLKEVCERSPIKIIKEIRLKLQDVSHFFEVFPNFKIVHLIRDPRATLYSQFLYGKCKKQYGYLRGCANTYCTRVQSDAFEEEIILKKYPGRILPVFYKDIAREPMKMSKKLYDFIGAEFTSEIEQYVFNITMAGTPDGRGICSSVRSNSSKHIDQWKQKMSPIFLKIINDKCGYIINKYGFDKLPEHNRTGDYANYLRALHAHNKKQIII